MQKLALVATSLIAMSLSTLSVAATSIEFYASNTTTAIDLQAAYKRLQGSEQQSLKQKMLGVLQKNHIENGKFIDVLGTYQMATEGNTTADNTDTFITSPNQPISEKNAFSIAKQLAESMQLENVTVFIPSDNASVGKLKIKFTSHEPTVSEVVELVHQNLPIAYSQAYSLQLENTHTTFNKAKVSEIVWLGSMIDLKEVRKAFPNEKISYEKGMAYLVYQDGMNEKL
jgi:hypothetical protein